MIKKMETTCYNELCDYKQDADYDYFILSVLFLIGTLFINVI